MDLPRLDTFAASHPELAAMPPGLRTLAVPLQCEQGRMLARIGDRPRSMFFVAAGELSLSRHTKEGTQVVLQRATRGFVAEASMDSARYHCDIVARIDSTLWCFPVEPFRRALHQHEAFRTAWQARLLRELKILRARCERLTLRSAAERVLHCIEAEGEDGRLCLSQTRRAWAAELGLTPEALYRALSSLRAAGRIELAETSGAVTLAIRERQ
jgi:CRP-like cAMP-binding protein